MKSKPASKKIKLEASNSPARNASPSNSSASSLLSIPPPSSSSTPKASAADIVAAAKAVASAVKSQQSPAVVPQGPKTSSGPAFPTYIHPDLKEWPRMNVLINCPEGNTDEDGNPSVTLGPEGIMNMEDLDALQAELETLWSATATRIRSLKMDQVSLQNAPSSSLNVAAVLGEHFDPHHQEKINAVASLIDAGHGTRTSVSAAAKLVMGSQQLQQNSTAAGNGGSSNNSSIVGVAVTAAAPVNKKAATGAKSQDTKDKLPKKKLKGEASGATKKGSDKPARATQNRSHSVSSDFGGLDGGFYKHEAPSEFWEFADKYCGEIYSEGLTELSRIIEEHGKISESLFEMPPLGKHFKDEETTYKAKSEVKPQKRIDACGPLTQRLVSALVDDRVAMYNNQRLASPKEDPSSGNGSHELGFIHRAGLIKALGLDGSGSNRPPMENQLRECLLDRGLLHPDDANDPLLFNPDDEILVEIKRTQNTLKKLYNYNGDRLKELFAKAELELERSSIKIELDKADKEVIDAYKMIFSLKQKKKPITKKEKDVAMKALENRNKTIEKLSPPDIPTTSPTTTLKIDV